MSTYYISKIKMHAPGILFITDKKEVSKEQFNREFENTALSLRSELDAWGVLKQSGNVILNDKIFKIKCK